MEANTLDSLKRRLRRLKKSQRKFERHIKELKREPESDYKKHSLAAAYASLGGVTRLRKRLREFLPPDTPSLTPQPTPPLRWFLPANEHRLTVESLTRLLRKSPGLDCECRALHNWLSDDNRHYSADGERPFFNAWFLVVLYQAVMPMEEIGWLTAKLLNAGDFHLKRNHVRYARKARKSVRIDKDRQDKKHDLGHLNLASGPEDIGASKKERQRYDRQAKLAEHVHREEFQSLFGRPAIEPIDPFAYNPLSALCGTLKAMFRMATELDTTADDLRVRRWFGFTHPRWRQALNALLDDASARMGRQEAYAGPSAPGVVDLDGAFVAYHGGNARGGLKFVRSENNLKEFGSVVEAWARRHGGAA